MKLNSNKGFIQLSNEDLPGLSALNELGYEFDWTSKSSDKSQTVAMLTDGNVAGLVEFERQPQNLLNYLFLIEVAKDYRGTGVAGMLLAYVARDSLQQGFEGFVLFESKTALIGYYIEKYGAKRLRAKGRQLYFDQEAAERLVAEYL